MKKINILYISYDGILEPLGQSQVLAYLKNLANFNDIHLISYEKSADLTQFTELKRVTKEISDAGIKWYPLKYHKNPTVIATAWDVVCGLIFAFYLTQRHKVNLIHARSYVPSLIAIIIKKVSGVKFVFDMRGFWADEKVDGGLWSRTGLLYKLTKWLERHFLLSSDHIVTLTNAAVREIHNFKYFDLNFPPITVIPTCADLSIFNTIPTSKINKNKDFILGYIGSVGTYYMFDEVIKCFKSLLKIKPNAKFLIINRGQHPFILERLAIEGVPTNLVELISVNHTEMPSQISRMNAGIFFIKPVFSKQASAPTKLAEFLGCGIPCLTNAGVGDVAEVLENEHVGVALKSLDNETFNIELRRFLKLIDDPETNNRCRNAAKKYYELDIGVQRYQLIYNSLL